MLDDHDVLELGELPDDFVGQSASDRRCRNPTEILEGLHQQSGNIWRVLNSANPYPGRDGEFARAVIAAGEGAGVPVARLLPDGLLPDARLVRAFNSVYFKTLQTEALRSGDRVGIPLAGDDAAALDVAARLIRDAGFEPVVAGPLTAARSFDPGTPVYNTGMSGADLARALGVARTPQPPLPRAGEIL